jgi:hypothetical protein
MATKESTKVPKARLAMMATTLPSEFASSTKAKLAETSSGKFFQLNNPKLLPSFDRGVVESGEVVGDGECIVHMVICHE